jgi:hypothetical protein
MTLEPRGSGTVVHEAREAARRQARSISAGLLAIVGAGLALLTVGLFVLLDYRFDQDPHRLVKILAGAALLATIGARPDLGLLSLPVLTPFLGWMPKIPAPGVNPLNILVFGVFFAFAIPAVIRRESILSLGRIGGLLLAIVVLGGVSIIRGAAFPTGFRYDAADAGIQLFRCSMTFTVYFIGFAMTRTARQRRGMAWAIVLGLLAESIATIVYGRIGRGGRATGSFGQSNDLGAFLALFTVFAAALGPGVRQWYGRIVLWGAVAAGCVAVFLTISRGAIIALGVGLLLVAARTSRALLIVLLALMATSPLWVPDFVKERVMSTKVEDEEFDEVTLESSSQLRVDTWRAIADVVTEHPLDGVGFAGLGYVLPETGSALGVQVKDSAHSTYMRFPGEMGVFGLALFLWLLFKCYKLGREAERKAEDAFDRSLGMALSLGTIVLAIACAFGDRFFPIIITGNFWIACALGNSVVRERDARA